GDVRQQSARVGSFHIVNTIGRVLIYEFDRPFCSLTIVAPKSARPPCFRLIGTEIESIDQRGGHRRPVQKIAIDWFGKLYLYRPDLVNRAVVTDDRLQRAGPGCLNLINWESHPCMLRRQNTGL